MDRPLDCQYTSYNCPGKTDGHFTIAHEEESVTLPPSSLSSMFLVSFGKTLDDTICFLRKC